MENLAISHDYVLSAFDYQDGNLIRKSGRVNVIGQIAGCVHKGTGYIHVKIKATAHKAHRLVFLYHHGYLPDFVDHIDGDKTNNSASNLEYVTSAENTQHAYRIGLHDSKNHGRYIDGRATKNNRKDYQREWARNKYREKNNLPESKYRV